MLFFLCETAGAEEPAPSAAPQTATKSVTELAELVRKSVVVVSYSGRDGRQAGLGAGFILSADGLIATNLHVIGEARPISVTLANGKRYDVTEIHATESAADLAVVKIDAKELQPLPLGDSDSLKQGEEIVAVGNPRGLEFSIVAGVVSGRRELEGKSMIQLAIPIEQGNSGGPLLDRMGRVHGLLTLKSIVTENLGFAMPINLLKPLLEKPNPVPMDRWLTIGALDAKSWNPLFGARWRQRAGRIAVEGSGDGFGGRSLCLSKAAVPAAPYEVAVEVRLDDEEGAAGLVFHSDGMQTHYGFYPSNGKLRLSRFDGPDVYSWNVLREVSPRGYRPHEWNLLKVRIEPGKIRCFLNEEPVIESTDNHYARGSVGLAKFRNTKAEFRHFVIAAEIPSRKVPDAVREKIAKLTAEIDLSKPPSVEMLAKLSAGGETGPSALREEAVRLERQAERLKRLAQTVHERRIRGQLVEELSKKEDDVDLLRATLLVAHLDNDEVDVAAYLGEVDRIAADIKATFPADADDKAKLALLDKHLFQTLGYHGSRVEYYSKSNSYLNEVIDDREGLPITLSVLYLELARRVGLKLEGVGLPGRFIVRFVPRNGEEELIDVFENGKRLTRSEASEKVREITERPPSEEEWKAQSKKAVITRMIQNLVNAAKGDMARGASYAETLVALHPDSVANRWYRAVAFYRAGRFAESKADTDWLLERDEKDLKDIVDQDQVQTLKQILESVGE